MAEGHFQGTKGSSRGGPQRSTDTPAPRPVEEEGGVGKVFLKGCASGLSKVCEERDGEKRREEKAIMYVYERHEVFVIIIMIYIYLFYLSLFIKICVMTCENDTSVCERERGERESFVSIYDIYLFGKRDEMFDF